MLDELDRLEREATDADQAESWEEGYIRDLGGWLTEADIALIVAARNNLRPLLELVRKQHEVLEEAVEWRDKLAVDGGSQEAWEALVEGDGCLDNEGRAAIAKYEALK